MPSNSNDQNNKIRRNFYYYDFRLLKKDQDGNCKEAEDNEKAIYSAFVKIEDNNADSIIKYGSDERLYIIPDLVKRDEPIRFRFVLGRTEGLPMVEQEGILTDLSEHIDSDFALAEITHCVLFPNTGILSAEYNYTGARVTALKEYFPAIDKNVDDVYCAARFQSDVLEQLEKNKRFSLFQLSVKNTSAIKKYIIENKPAILLPFTKINDTDTFEVTIKRRKGKSKDGFVSPMTFDEASELIDTCYEDINKFKVSQGSLSSDAVDLLKQRVVCRTYVNLTGNKMVDSECAYRKMINFYNEKFGRNFKR